MDNSNIIISIIIVLCIAAGVTAYGISEGNNAVFNDLTGFTPSGSDSGSNGIGDLFGNNSNQGTDSGASTGASTTPNSGGSSSNGGSNNNNGGTGTGNGGNSGSSSNGGSGNGGSSNQSQPANKISAQEAQTIASQYIGEPGAYVSNVKDDGTEYICYISNSNGTVVDAIGISYTGENLGKI